MVGGRGRITARRWWLAGASLTAVLPLMAGLGLGLSPVPHGRPVGLGLTDPPRSVPADPAYIDACAMSGLDTRPACLGGALQAVDNARAREGMGPMRLPAAFAAMPFDRQMLIVVNAERVNRGLAPVAGISPALDHLAAAGARVDDLPPRPGAGYTAVRRDALSAELNAIDVDYQWLYDDGPGSGAGGCDQAGDPGCWADRHVVLAACPAGARLVMGAAQDPTGDTQDYDDGGPSMSIMLADQTGPAAPLSFTWAEAEAAIHRAVLAPLADPGAGESATGIADPSHTEPGHYLSSCAASGLDDSVRCRTAVLAAIDRARAAEGVKPMALPAGFAAMDIVEQLFVVTNLERVDRGLPPFVGLTTALDANAARGAATADDPPGLNDVIGEDGEWAGGSVNALDADYGWMYDDGRGSGNIDCPRTGGPGCWGHRNGILDDFGTVGTMAMGAAYDPTGDTAAEGWAGGTSMAMTLAAEPYAPHAYTVTWAQVEAGRTGAPSAAAG
jgi:hypothetical protein